MKKIPAIIIISAFIFGCQKSDRDLDTALNSATDNAFASNITFHIFKIIDEASKNTLGIPAQNPASPLVSLYGCDTIVSDTNASPMNMYIDFGSSCTTNGRNYSGIINANFNGKYNIPGSYVNINFINYYFSGYSIFGNMTINCQNPSSNGSVYNITTNNLTALASNGKQLSFTANYIYERIEGDTSFTATDDAYLVSGSASGYSFLGNSFTSNITSNIRFEYGCKWMISGNEEVTPLSKSVRKVDYGSGCDNAFTIDINGTVYDSTIP
jgi:hypothetical protein